MIGRPMASARLIIHVRLTWIGRALVYLAIAMRRFGYGSAGVDLIGYAYKRRPSWMMRIES